MRAGETAMRLTNLLLLLAVAAATADAAAAAAAANCGATALTYMPPMPQQLTVHRESDLVRRSCPARMHAKQ